MKQLIVIFLLCIGVSEAIGQNQNMKELPVEIDTVINGIDTKMIFLDVYLEPEKGGAFVKIIIGFRNPETQEWLWLDATDVPFNTHGFTKSFNLKIRGEFEGHDTSFSKSIAEPAGSKNFYVALPLQAAHNFLIKISSSLLSCSLSHFFYIWSMAEKIHIGRKIGRIRELRGMKQEAIAEALGISQQAISKLENSETVEVLRLIV